MDLQYGYEIAVSLSQFFVPSIALAFVYGKILLTLIRRNRETRDMMLHDDRDLDDNRTRAATRMDVDSEVDRVQSLAAEAAQAKQRQLRRKAMQRSYRATFICCYCLAAFIVLWCPLQTALVLRAIGYFAPEIPFWGIKLPDGYWMEPSHLILLDALASLFTIANPILYCGTSK